MTEAVCHMNMNKSLIYVSMMFCSPFLPLYFQFYLLFYLPLFCFFNSFHPPFISAQSKVVAVPITVDEH